MTTQNYPVWIDNGKIEIDNGETLTILTVKLSASVRATDGHSDNYPVYYGPLLYNLVIQRAPTS